MATPPKANGKRPQRAGCALNVNEEENKMSNFKKFIVYDFLHGIIVENKGFENVVDIGRKYTFIFLNEETADPQYFVHVVGDRNLQYEIFDKNISYFKIAFSESPRTKIAFYILKMKVDEDD